MSTSDSLLDEILSYQVRASQCGVARVLEELEDPERKAVLTALEAPNVSSPAIRKFLDVRGVHITDRTLQRHRSGGCGCARG